MKNLNWSYILVIVLGGAALGIGLESCGVPYFPRTMFTIAYCLLPGAVATLRR